jgi:hypothetical protein
MAPSHWSTNRSAAVAKPRDSLTRQWGDGGAGGMGREKKCRSRSAGSWWLAEEGSRKGGRRTRLAGGVITGEERRLQGAHEAHAFGSSFCPLTLQCEILTARAINSTLFACPVPRTRLPSSHCRIPRKPVCYIDRESVIFPFGHRNAVSSERRP